MPDWDQNSPRLRQNLTNLLRQIRDESRERHSLNSETIRRWHASVMQGLDVPVANASGAFRGEHGMEDIGVRVGREQGVPPDEVADALSRFDRKLRQIVDELDGLIPAGELPSSDLLPAVLEVCAWAHAEWVRVHPFANGNGRTARLLANALAMRYGLPPFVRLRPRPGGDYGVVCEAAMRENWRPTAETFRAMCDALTSTVVMR